METLLCPDDSNVDFRRIIEEARDERGCSVSRSRWDKHQRKWNAPWRQNSSASSSDGQWQEGLEEQRVGWSSVERRGHRSSGELLG